MAIRFDKLLTLKVSGWLLAQYKKEVSKRGMSIVIREHMIETIERAKYARKIKREKRVKA